MKLRTLRNAVSTKPLRRIGVRMAMVFLLLVAMAGCFDLPVRQQLEISFLQDGSIEVTHQMEIASERSSGSEAIKRRVGDLREKIRRGDDPWRSRFDSLDSLWDETTTRREEAELVRVERRARVEDPETLAGLFEASDITMEFLERDGEAELVLRTDSPRRVTMRQRDEYHEQKLIWAKKMALYINATGRLYHYLEVHPDRALFCMYSLLHDVTHGIPPGLVENQAPTPDEEILLPAVFNAMHEAAGLFSKSKSSDYTLEELSALINDPFPAALTVRVTGDVLDVTGFVEKDQAWTVPGLSFWRAWQQTRREWISPDPLEEAIKYFVLLRKKKPASSIIAFADRPRHAASVTTETVLVGIETMLKPALEYRLRWRRIPPKEEENRLPDGSGGIPDPG